MTTAADALGVIRQHLSAMRNRPPPRPRGQSPQPDAELVADLRPLAAGLPTYNYHRGAFALDCCGREATGDAATTGGIAAEGVQDLMVATVEHRYGPVNRLPKPIEWLSDNGSCYTARNSRAFARDIGLIPRTSLVGSPQSNGMAEAFVRMLKCVCVRVNSRSNPQDRHQEAARLSRPLHYHP